jgi:hypothetical protein
MDYGIKKSFQIKNCHQHKLQSIWAFGLMDKIGLYLEDLANLANLKDNADLIPNCL